MEDNAYLESIMGLIMHGGDAKGKAVDAIRAAKKGEFVLANELIEQANKALTVAHQSQTSLLSQEASGESVQLSLLLVHGQDHLMTAIAFIDLAKELVQVYEKISTLEK